MLVFVWELCRNNAVNVCRRFRFVSGVQNEKNVTMRQPSFLELYNLTPSNDLVQNNNKEDG